MAQWPGPKRVAKITAARLRKAKIPATIKSSPTGTSYVITPNITIRISTHAANPFRGSPDFIEIRPRNYKDAINKAVAKIIKISQKRAAEAAP